MYLWKVYFNNGSFTLIWADGISFTDNSITFLSTYNKLIARFNLKNIAGYEKCIMQKESVL